MLLCYFVTSLILLTVFVYFLMWLTVILLNKLTVFPTSLAAFMVTMRTQMIVQIG